MVVYSIKDLESLSGVKAHTLRIWEKRYDLIQPKRTKSNIRFYTDEDLRKLLNVCYLYKKGYKISKIGQMCHETIKNKVSNYSKCNLSFKDQLDALMIFILDLDSYNFNMILDQNISQIGMERTMMEIIYPLLDKLSIAWLAGSFLEVHESYVTQIIKSKILASTEKLEEKHNHDPCYMVFLSPGEEQELSLLYLHYILKANACKVVNLGTGVNLSDVNYAIDACNPDYVFTIINQEIENMPLQNFVDHISQGLNGATLLLTGYQTLTPGIKWPKNVEILEDLEQTLKFIKQP